MIWGLISNSGPEDLIFLDGHIDSDFYIEILKKSVICNNNFMKNYILAQDNAPCHSSKKTIKFIEEKKINIIEWPPQSPDLNPIENIWALIKNHVYLKRDQIRNIQQLKDFITEFFFESELIKVAITNAYKNLHNRYQKVVDNDGMTCGK